MSRWLFLSFMIVLLDQTSKQFAEALLTAYQSVYVLPYFDLTLMYNKGAAFSFLSEQSGWQRWFFVVLALVVTAILVVWLKRLKAEEKWIAIALSLIIGGALGNVIDRILFGQVIDFVHLHYAEHYFPAFNLADSAISIGVAIMLIDAFFFSKTQPKDSSAG